jgi:hypothetical protein
VKKNTALHLWKLLEDKRKSRSVNTWKKLGAALDVGWEMLA